MKIIQLNYFISLTNLEFDKTEYEVLKETSQNYKCKEIGGYQDHKNIQKHLIKSIYVNDHYARVILINPTEKGN